MKHAITWFDIPALDYDRAKEFYEEILDETLTEQIFDNVKMAFLPSEEEGVGGAISKIEDVKPGKNGVIIYLNVDGKLDEVASRIVPAGGEILVPRRDISPHGFIVIMIDSEGNKIGLHSMT